MSKKWGIETGQQDADGEHWGHGIGVAAFLCVVEPSGANGCEVGPYKA